MNRGLWNLSFFLMLSGLAAIAAGMIWQSFLRRREDLTGHTRGKVIDLALREIPEDESSPFQNRYFPVIEFYAEGKLYKENYPYGSYPSAFQIGDEVRINYDPSDPHEYEIRKSSARERIAWGLCAGGIGLVIGGAAAFIVFAARG